ncbi:hypothetical protein LSTR_LSTR005399 [Laodelphax striatellus]|uniref:Protein kinase domain-containing protein n=1 Tax=Laodelphax striatellus TaxID=195883 RepID=A0A482WRT5_LAOST|nr:hypothetical protein LSTR_LSTR005399 [Laodelphax striatellus]
MEEIPQEEELVEENISPTAAKDDYMVVSSLGTGKFATVYRAVHTGEDLSSMFYAVKRNYHASVAEREIKALKKLEETKNVVKMFDIMYENPKVLSIVLELCREDFFNILIVKKISIGLPEMKNVIYQFLQGLQAIHSQKIIHGDIKSANLLISFDGVIKICDFGSSIVCEPVEDASLETATNEICGLWYKAPEVLLGDVNLSDKVDLWAAGCVIFEFWSNQILFKGNTERLQLISITQTCGFVSEEIWEGVKNLDAHRYCKYRMWARKYLTNHLRGKLDRVTSSFQPGTDLMLSLLNLNPDKRKSAEDLLAHEFFGGSNPPADNLSKLIRRLDKSLQDVEVPTYLHDACFCVDKKVENDVKEMPDDNSKLWLINEETQTEEAE